MNLLNKNVYLYFWTTAIVLIAVSFYLFYFQDSVIDINVHDTYFVIHNSHILQLLAFIYIFLGFIYWLFKKGNIKLITVLTKVHTAFTLLVIPVYLIGYHLFILFFESNFPMFDHTPKIQIFLKIIVLVTLIAQLLLILNVIIGLFKHFIRKN